MVIKVVRPSAEAPRPEATPQADQSSLALALSAVTESRNEALRINQALTKRVIEQQAEVTRKRTFVTEVTEYWSEGPLKGRIKRLVTTEQ